LKCFRYYPSSKETDKNCRVPDGLIHITFVKEISFAGYDVREFQVTRWLVDDKDDNKNMTQLDEPRQIYQYHYTAWPDHGLPENPGEVVQFLQEVNNCHKKLGGYLLVHCSAGIGRTGTFILIDMLIQDIESKGLTVELDIFQALDKIRQQRSGLVQTKGQYRFLYEALAEYIQQELPATVTPEAAELVLEKDEHVYNN